MNRGRISIKYADDRRNTVRCKECCKQRELEEDEVGFERHGRREHERDEERFDRRERREHERDEERFDRRERREHERNEERFDRREHREHERRTILRCGTSTGSGPLPVNKADCRESSSHIFHPLVQATVVLDTDRLIDPTVKIDFSSLISFRTSGDDFLLNIMFRLSKICREEERIPLGTWTFEKSQFEEKWKNRNESDQSIQETEAFCFTWCESEEDRDEHCRYIVEIIDLQSYNIDFAIVSNVSLTALAVGFNRR